MTLSCLQSIPAVRLWHFKAAIGAFVKLLITSLAFAGGLSALAEPVLALSCDRRDRVQRMFADHDARAERYILAYGTLSPSEPVPVFNQDTQRLDPDRIGALFEGYLATTAGFDQRAVFDVTVEIGCTIDVCGVVPVERPALIFVRAGSEPYTVATEYCLGSVLANPTSEELEGALDCLSDQNCGAW